MQSPSVGLRKWELSFQINSAVRKKNYGVKARSVQLLGTLVLERSPGAVGWEWEALIHC